MKKLLTIMITMMLLSCITASAQYGWYCKPFNETLRQVYFYDSDMGFLLTAESVIYKTNDKGKNWSKITYAFEPFTKIKFVSKTTGYAINYKNIYRSFDGGNTWHESEFDDLTEHHVDEYLLFGLDFVNDSVGYVAGGHVYWDSLAVSKSFAYILRTTNGGNSWSQQILDSINIIEHVNFVTPNSGWALTFDGTVLRSYNGEDWIVNSNIDIKNENRTLGLQFKNEFEGLIPAGRSINVSTDGGLQWEAHAKLTNESYWGMFFFDKNNVYAAKNTGKIVKSTDGGNNWTEQNIQTNGENIYPYKIAFADAENGFALANKYLIRTTTGGTDVEQFSASIQVAGNQPACDGDTIVLTASPVGSQYSYLWSNGETTSSIKVTRGGSYSVLVETENAVNSTFSVNLSYYPLPSFGIFGDSVVCFGEVAYLSSDTEFSSYLWSTGETTRTITVEEAGTYSLTVENEYGCPATQSFVVENRKVKLSSASNYLDFDSLEVGTKLKKTITFKNEEDDAVNISTASISTNSGIFRIVNIDDFPASVMPGETLPVEIEFAPNTEGLVHDFLMLDILTPCPGNFAFPLQGIGKKSVSVKDEHNTFSIYPNPAGDVLYIQNNTSGSHIRIFSIDGSELMNCESAELINISEFSTGVYYIQIGNITKLFVKIGEN